MKNSISAHKFNSIFNNCKSLRIGDLLFRVGNEDGSGLGFAVSKRYGNAVKRNLFRRRVKSVFSLMNRIHFFNKPIIVQPLGRDITFSSIEESFSNLYSKNV